MSASNLIVEFKLLHPDAVRPEYKTDGASGMDLCMLREDGSSNSYSWLSPGERRLYLTGIAVNIPSGWEGQVRPRSGFALKEGITVLNNPGTIDSDYRGDVSVLLVNLSDSQVTIKRGDRIAQLVFAPVARASLQRVPEFTTQTKRGEGGFGSTNIDPRCDEAGKQHRRRED